MKRKQPTLAPEKAVCEVCRDVRDECDVDDLCVDVGERYGLAGNLWFIVRYCCDRQICHQTAVERAEAIRTARTPIEVQLPSPQPLTPNP